MSKKTLALILCAIAVLVIAVAVLAEGYETCPYCGGQRIVSSPRKELLQSSQIPCQKGGSGTDTLNEWKYTYVAECYTARCSGSESWVEYVDDVLCRH